jgi:ABC-type sugar transport system ATPase subunit
MIRETAAAGVGGSLISDEIGGVCSNPQRLYVMRAGQTHCRKRRDSAICASRGQNLTASLARIF